MMKLDNTNKNIDSGKIIRDQVHGDIYFDSKFSKVINTKEFQRLRRIKQLSIGNMIFPSANHTRFSHSIGTYHIMGLIIKHFEKDFKNIKMSEENKKIALLIALLHDIGHGPFSHCFEIIFKTNHEEMTCEIIKGNTEVNEVLKREFGSEYPKKIIEIIQNKYTGENKGIDLFFVLKSLISSQLDADRLDYIVRDAQNTGVMLGKIDIQRIIDSIRVTEYNDKIYTCILEKNLVDIEDYIDARYKMHETIYFHLGKCELEEIIKLIFMRVKELNKYDGFSFPNNIVKLLNKKIDLETYIEIDDYDMISSFKELAKIGDNILKILCDAILYRKKFEKLDLLDNSKANIESFEKKLRNLIKIYSENYEERHFKYSFINGTTTNTSYKEGKDIIYVLKKNGVVSKLHEMKKEIVKEHKKNYVLINKGIILNYIPNKDQETFSEKLELLIREYDNRNFIEIERKVLLDETIKKEDILKLVKEFDRDIVIDEKGEENYVDTYYDYEENLLKLRQTLRYRFNEVTKEKRITFKKPVSIENITERFEYEFDIKGLSEVEIEERISESVDKAMMGNLVENLKINSKKNKFYVELNGCRYEFSYDEISYLDKENKFKEEFELEIELKSNYYHRVNLKEISDYIVNKLEGGVFTKESKYERGLKYLKMERE